MAVLALLLVGLLAWGISAVVSAFGGDEQPGGGTEVSEPADPGQDLPETEGQPAEEMCQDSEVEVTASTDEPSYTADRTPVLILGVKNTSSRDCKLNVGTSQQEFMVMSGSDRIFSTADCAAPGEDVMLEFKAGQEETARFNWQRERSAPGCKAVDIQPKPGTYKFTAVLGGIESEPKSFELK